MDVPLIANMTRVWEDADHSRVSIWRARLRDGDLSHDCVSGDVEGIGLQLFGATFRLGPRAVSWTECGLARELYERIDYAEYDALDRKWSEGN